MKKHILFLVVPFVLVAACKKPEACITASNNNPKLGEEVVFTNCSQSAKKSTIDVGDGTRKQELRSSTHKHAYGDPGTYNVILEALTKNEKKSDAAIAVITVPPPAREDVEGSWQLTRLVVHTNIIFPVTMSTDLNESWFFGSGGDFGLDGYLNYNWTLASNILTTSASSWNFRIVKLFNNEMILRFDEIDWFGGFYSEYHLTRQ